MKHPPALRAAPFKGRLKIKKQWLLIFTGFAPFEGGSLQGWGMCFNLQGGFRTRPYRF
jgi:hypothetical protein